MFDIPFTFLAMLLLTVSVAQDKSPAPSLAPSLVTTSDGDCCYKDACSGTKICGEPYETFTDDCGGFFRITEECGLSRRCCYADACSAKKFCTEAGQTFRDSCGTLFLVSDQCKLSNKSCCYTDACSAEKICAEDGILRDSCGATFDVATNCTLSASEKDDEENGMQAGPTGTEEPGSEPTSSEDSIFSLAPSPSSETSDSTSTQATVTPTPQGPVTTPTPSTTEATNEDGTVNSVSSAAVCIHSQHLSHLPYSALVFPRHVIANVLCDSFASCATPGHMVVYKGESMRMSGYCKIVGCQRERGLVNSPKYSRGGRVESNTRDLVFTMLAARFETRSEEILLAGLVRVGL